MCTYLSYCLIDLFFMRVHLDKSSNLRKVYTFSISQGNDFIECKYKIECIICNFTFFQRPTVFWNLKINRNLEIMKQNASVYVYVPPWQTIAVFRDPPKCCWRVWWWAACTAFPVAGTRNVPSLSPQMCAVFQPALVWETLPISPLCVPWSSPQTGVRRLLKHLFELYQLPTD